MRLFKYHIAYYLVLLAILSTGFVVISYFAFNKNAQLVVTGITTSCYIIWGLLHHAIHHDITVKIVIEYILMGLVGFSLIAFLLIAGL